MDRQTLRDWVIRFNERGPDGLVNIPSPGAPPKLDDTHRAFLARIVEEGPIPAVHGVVRWRACDLITRLYEEFALSASDDTIYRALKDLGYPALITESLINASTHRLRHPRRALKPAGVEFIDENGGGGPGGTVAGAGRKNDLTIRGALESAAGFSASERGPTPLARKRIKKSKERKWLRFGRSRDKQRGIAHAAPRGKSGSSELLCKRATTKCSNRNPN
jgi:hypothetical protein